MYAFAHQGKGFLPDGSEPIAAADVDTYNKQVEAQEIEHLKTGPERIFSYIGHKPMTEENGADPHKTYGFGEDHYCIQTWLGTFLGWAWVGAKSVSGFQGHFRGGTYRRPVTARIFGTLYHGWYYQSSGDYVRLKKAKKQDMRYGATQYVA